MSGLPDYVARPSVAAPYEDVEAAIITGRKVACICPEQGHGVSSCTFGYSTARGLLVWRVGCDRCLRTWMRITS